MSQQNQSHSRLQNNRGSANLRTEGSAPAPVAQSGDKERTWPCCVCSDPTQPDLWNVRALDGHVIFCPGLTSKRMATQAKNALNEHFDYGRSAGR